MCSTTRTRCSSPAAIKLKITSQIGGTPVYDRIREIYRNGGVVAGTSAGASVVCGTMLTAGSGQTSPRLGESVQMAPGLAFIRNVIIDQHFAERGRMGRLLAAVGQNPRTQASEWTRTRRS